MKYVKVFADEEGETHFEDVDVELESVEIAPPAPPVNLSPYSPATRYALSVFPSGWDGGWHSTPYRRIFFILSGESEAQVSDGEVRRFSAGSILLAEDTSGKGHLSRVIGSKDMVVAMVQLPD